MGLDNGIDLKIVDKESFGTLPKWFIKRTTSYFPDSYEIAYWRKCWNVRELALDMFYDLYNNETYKIEMTVDLLEQFNCELKKLYNRKAWNSGNSIWTWKECRRRRKSSLRFCNRVIKMLKSKPADSYRLVFYDSY